MPIHNSESFEVEEHQGSNNVITFNGQIINNGLIHEQVSVYDYQGRSFFLRTQIAVYEVVCHRIRISFS
jgi:hypothetical protein